MILYLITSVVFLLPDYVNFLDFLLDLGVVIQYFL